MSPNGVDFLGILKIGLIFLGVLKMMDTVAHLWPWQMNTHTYVNIYASE